jgi:hypothetical protein
MRNIYLNDYGDGLSADRGLRGYFKKYNHSRPHQAPSRSVARTAVRTGHRR